MNGQYSWPGGTENLLMTGANAPVQLILIPPLFEEANRLRKTLVAVMRGLAAQGLGVTLPDLPATNESVAAYGAATLDDWQAALVALVQERRALGQTVLSAAFRGGALIDHAADIDGRWRLAPETGARLLRDLSRRALGRSRQMHGGDALDESGYVFPPALKAALEAAIPQPANALRLVRLAQDAGAADARIAGAPLWRRTEPGEDPALSQAIITDIAEWAHTCA